jgi:hypothetical protein
MAFRQLTSLPLSFAAHIRPVDGSIHTDRVGRPFAIARSDNTTGISRAVIKATSGIDCLALITTIVGPPYSFSCRVVPNSEVWRVDQLAPPLRGCPSYLAAIPGLHSLARTCPGLNSLAPTGPMMRAVVAYPEVTRSRPGHSRTVWTNQAKSWPKDYFAGLPFANSASSFSSYSW